MARAQPVSPENARHLPMFILDVLRHDVEQVPSVLRLLNNRGSIGWREDWPRDFVEADVLPALKDLVDQGLVQPLKYSHLSQALEPIRDPADVQRDAASLWFVLMKRGWQAWEDWEPPPDVSRKG